jgi:hypothetical protein
VVANGSTGAATLQSGAARSLPASQRDPEGFAVGIESSDVIDVVVEILPSSCNAQE